MKLYIPLYLDGGKIEFQVRKLPFPAQHLMWLATKMSLTFFFVLLVIVSSLWYITTYKVAILIIPDAIYSVQGMHSSYTHKCCGVYPMFLFYIYMYKCGKKTVVSFWDQKVISVCCTTPIYNKWLLSELIYTDLLLKTQERRC